MTRGTPSRDKSNKDTLSSTGIGRLNQSGGGNGDTPQREAVTAAAAAVTTSPGLVNGFGNHSDEDEDKYDRENILNGTYHGIGVGRHGHGDHLSASNGNGEYTTMTLEESQITAGSDFGRDARAKFLKDNTNNKVNSSVAIPLPPPTSPASTMTMTYTMGAGGNSSYESRHGATSPSPTPTWDLNITRLDPGDVGFQNIGNTCFMNSALQCLVHTSPLAEYFLRASDLESACPTSLSLVHTFQSLVNTVWSGAHQSLYLHEFRSVLGNIHSQFRDGRQHDCQEFLALALDTMHEQLKKWLVLTNSKSQEKNENVETTPNGEGEIEIGVDASELEKEAGSDTKVSGASCNRVFKRNVSSSESKLSAEGKSHSFDFEEEEDENVELKRFKLSAIPRLLFNFKSNDKLSGEMLEEKKSLLTKLKGPSVVPTKRPLQKNYRKASEMEQTNSQTPENTPARKKSCTSSRDIESARSQITSDDCQDLLELQINSEDPTKSEVNTPTSPASDCTDRLGDISPSNSDDVPTKKRKEEDEGGSLQDMSRKVDEFWEAHIKNNMTVIANTFQGVYKSVVTCSACTNVSATYEPFMYLSLPIPRTVSRQLEVTFVSARDKRTFKTTITANVSDSIAQLKEDIVKNSPSLQSVDVTKLDEFVVAEVVNYHVTRVLGNSSLVKYLDDTNKNIYMYELNDNFDMKYPTVPGIPIFNGLGSSPNPSTSTNMNTELSTHTYLTVAVTSENWEPDQRASEVNGFGAIHGPLPEIPSCSSSTDNVEVSSTSSENGTAQRPGWLQCCVCQDDFPQYVLKKHDCGSILCKDCTMRAAQYFETSEENIARGITGGTHLDCPICRRVVEHEKEYKELQYSSLGLGAPSIQFTSVLFRSDPPSDSNNNSSHPTRLFGTPLTIKIPFSLQAEELYELVNTINPFPELPFRVLNVCRDGGSCGQCLCTKHCHGCEFPKEGEVSLSRNSSIAICFTNLTEEQIASVQPLTMATISKNSYFTNFYSADNEPTIDIHQSLRTFSESEILDEQNPWFCPKCNKNQCATKSMAICRFPDQVIVYLKRFVYLEASSNKLNNKMRFPLTDLDLNPYLAPECQGEGNVFDLYSCICHFGTTSGGHYTAYAKNPVTQRWHYFNDNLVTEQTPAENGETDYAAAYVLFYERKGVQHNIPKVPRPSTPLSFSSMSRPIGQATPILAQRYYSGGSFGDSTSPSSSSPRPLPSTSTHGDGIKQFRDPIHPHISSTRHDYNNTQASTTTFPESDDEELPDIEDDGELRKEKYKWNWNGAPSLSLSNTNQQAFSSHSKLMARRRYPGRFPKAATESSPSGK